MAKASKKKKPDTTEHHVSTLKERTSLFPVVAIGASSGGLQALNELLENLQPDLGMAYVVIQHLSPTHESFLPELLSRKTDMKINVVKDGMHIEKNNIYVIPPNTFMSIVDSKLTLCRSYHRLAPYADGLIVTFYDIQNEKEVEKKKEENRQLLEAAKVEKARLEAEQKYRAELEQEIEKRTKELKETTHLISRVTDVMPDLLSVMDLSTRDINYINKKPLIEMGFDDVEKLTSGELARLIHPDDQALVIKYFEAFTTASDDDKIDVEYRAKIKTGEWGWFHARGKVFARDGSGKATHCVNIVQSIDKRKGAEQQIEKLNNDLVTKNEQLNSLNSELKKLNSITANNYTEALRHIYVNLETIITTDARNLSNSSRANLRRAQAAIQKMKLLSNDINNYLQLYDTEIKKENIFPNVILQNVIESLQKKIEESDAKLNIGKLPLFQADPILFSKLMTHLIDNSIKFHKENTEPLINISYSMIDLTTDKRSAVQNRPFIIISISDNGAGFENTEAIFKPFIQLHDHSKHKSAGIGLAICKKIMEMHGGFITADSTPDNGSTFNCYFPVDHSVNSNHT